MRKRRPVERELTTTERGYGNEHQKLRKKWQKTVEAGEATCSRCGRWIAPAGQPCPKCHKVRCGWHLDHSDDRSGYYGSSHGCCNVAAANKRRARKTRKPPLHSSGLW